MIDDMIERVMVQNHMMESHGLGVSNMNNCVE